jgi:uracil-DNA glycosylase/DNA polymerase I-like protein with 3'-5' exonuclease and polymerase domains
MPGRKVPHSGPIPSRIMIVGEAPGEEEEQKLQPFVGASGAELNKMLGEAGISRSECFITNVSKHRPEGNNIGNFFAGDKKNVTSAHKVVRYKMVTSELAAGVEELRAEINLVKPNIIIATGNTSLWALTGICKHPHDLAQPNGISDWRGSMLVEDLSGRNTQLIPTYHPAAVLRQWPWRAATVHDLRRAARFRSGERFPKPDWRFILRPSFDTVVRTLVQLRERLDAGEHLLLSYDIETRQGHIACAGLAWTLLDAICIPFMCAERRAGYWSEDEEAAIIYSLTQVINHKNAEVIGQYITYDSQYNYRHWHSVPNVKQDTMISMHSMFSDLPKDLAFQASLNCNYYRFWKDEGKDWAKNQNEAELWYYNCEDCVYTLEVALAHRASIQAMSTSSRVPWTQLPAVHEFQQKMFWPVLKAMQRGVLIDQQKRIDLIAEVEEQLKHREQFLADVLGHPLNPRSPKQMTSLFYEDLKLPVQYTRAKKGQPARPTLNDDALMKLALIEPIARPLINCIADIRTLGQFLSNFLRKPLDVDGRMRCSYNIGGSESGKSAPKTYRLSSSENAFGSGTNLQNIPSEKSKSLGKAAARGNIGAIGDPYQFPNIRSMFVPDADHTWFDGDLDRADLQVVVYEADDPMLKAALKMGADIHLMNVYSLDGKDPPPLDELVETHPRYMDHRGPRKLKREFAKVFCHGTNYGGGARTMAANTGRSIADIDRAQKLWFGAHPGIKKWHDRVADQVKRFRFVENRFGYRWYIFDRIDSLLPEAIAWGPQSTVSIVINKIWMNIHETLTEVEVLMQVHDSLCGQFRTDQREIIIPKIKTCGRITIPYEDPLVIPFGLKTSEVSWGEVK